jgi:membrane protease YdiL (CAAX protease family)
MQSAKVTKKIKFLVTFAQVMERKNFSGLTALWVLTAILFGGMIVGAIGVMPFAPLMGGTESELFTFVSYAAGFGVAVVCGAAWLMSRGALRLRVGIDWSAAPLILIGVVAMTAASVVVEPLLLAFPSKWFDMIDNMIGTGGWAILTTVVAAPLLEEIFFRGLVLETLAQKWRQWAAVVASAALFGIIHLIPPQAINAFVAAIVMGYLYLASRSLVPVIIIHAINNGLSYLSLRLFGTQAISTREMIGNDVLYWSVYAAAVVILVVAMIFLVRRARNKSNVSPLNTKTVDVEKQP